eukprot:599975-Pelagomonas_calceolata.AAC.2
MSELGINNPIAVEHVHTYTCGRRSQLGASQMQIRAEAAERLAAQSAARIAEAEQRVAAADRELEASGVGAGGGSGGRLRMHSLLA